MSVEISQPPNLRFATLCLTLLLMVVPLTQGQSAASDLRNVVRGFYGVLISNIKDGRILGESGRLARLAPVVDRTFDIPAMTRLAVGPHRRISPPPSSAG
jgi:phospholipid transport system substrate-binding protein